MVLSPCRRRACNHYNTHSTMHALTHTEQPQSSNQHHSVRVVTAYSQGAGVFLEGRKPCNKLSVLVAGLPLCVALWGLALEEYLFELIHLLCGVGEVVGESAVPAVVYRRFHRAKPHFLHVRAGVAEHAEGYAVESLVTVAG